MLQPGRKALLLELQEASRLPDRLDETFVQAAKAILDCKGKLIVSGMGKSGHIGKKLAATFASTGTPAFFVHPAEALHGDLGMVESRDVMLFISYSGSAKELDYLIPRRWQPTRCWISPLNAKPARCTLRRPPAPSTR